jgi:ribosomal protein L37AE/L43A
MNHAYIELMSDNRNLKMLPNHYSIFFHEKKSYNCPECNGPMDRAHIHGWYWFCGTCRKSFPLYVLEPAKEVVMEPAKPKGWMAKVKEALRG